MRGRSQAPNVAYSIAESISSTKYALVIMSLIVLVTVIDAQFVNAFYGTTTLGSPSDLHLLLFVSLAILTSGINVVLLLFVKRSDIHEKNSSSLFRLAYITTSAILCSTLAVLLTAIFEMFILHHYSKIVSVAVVYMNHFYAAGILGIISINFIQWFKVVKSKSILMYAVVFLVIVFILLLTIPLVTEQYMYHQPDLIYAADYLTLVNNAPIPSSNIAFIYGLGTYGLPLMIVSSWALTVSMLKPYILRIGKIKFWLIVSIPLAYQLITFIIRDANLVNDPALVDIIYSRQFQFLMGASYQVAGIFFAIAFLTIARKMRRKVMRNYLVISSLGMISLFSSMQPGIPFYAAYPPFGLITLIYLGLSSYMLLIGILGTAANVSRDAEIRREIYKGIADSPILKMGLAEMQREVESRILPIASRVKLSEPMRERTDPSEEDVKMMIEEVVKEMHVKRSPINPNDKPR
jgi:hypothetical protein